MVSLVKFVYCLLNLHACLAVYFTECVQKLMTTPPPDNPHSLPHDLTSDLQTVLKSIEVGKYESQQVISVYERKLEMDNPSFKDQTPLLKLSWIQKVQTSDGQLTGDDWNRMATTLRLFHCAFYELITARDFRKFTVTKQLENLIYFHHQLILNVEAAMRDFPVATELILPSGGVSSLDYTDRLGFVDLGDYTILMRYNSYLTMCEQAVRRLLPEKKAADMYISFK